MTAVLWNDETKRENMIADAKAAGIMANTAAAVMADPGFETLLEKDLKLTIENGGFNNHERPRGFVFLINPTEEEVTGAIKARKKGVRIKFEPHLDRLYKEKKFLIIIKQ